MCFLKQSDSGVCNDILLRPVTRCTWQVPVIVYTVRSRTAMNDARYYTMRNEDRDDGR